MGKRTYLGVYSSGNKDFSSVRRRLFFVWDNGQGGFDVQRVNEEFKPVDTVQTLLPRRFRAEFTLEPGITAHPDGEKTGVTPTGAQTPPLSAAEEVESTLRAHFRKAMLRCKRPGDRDAAIRALQTLAEVEEGIEPRHKYMFADFGISLRKERRHALALAFCRRVLDLAPHDDHAHFNAARVLLEMGDVDGAEQHLLTALDMDGKNRIYQRMLSYMKTQRRKMR